MNLDVQAEVSKAGFDTVADYFDHNPGITLRELATRLSGIAPIILLHAFFAEARRKGNVRAAMMDTFVRTFNAQFPFGWSWRIGSEQWLVMLADWSSEVLTSGQAFDYEQKVNRVIDVCREVKIPEGWKPASIQDAFVKELFQRAWGE